jgi:hypothetical protein
MGGTSLPHRPAVESALVLGYYHAQTFNLFINTSQVTDFV